MSYAPAVLTGDDATFEGLATVAGRSLLFEGARVPETGAVVLDADGAAWTVTEARHLADGTYAWATLVRHAPAEDPA